MTHVHPTLLEWLYAREVCRRLGFTPDEIFFVAYPSGLVVDEQTGMVYDCKMPVIGLELRRGSLEFKWTIGAIDMSREHLELAYRDACDAWNRGALDDAADGLMIAFKSSKAFSQALELMVALRRKGFTLQNQYTN